MKSFRRFISEIRKFEQGDRVRLVGKSASNQQKHGFATAGRIVGKWKSGSRDYFKVIWDDGSHSGTFDLHSQLGIDLQKEEAVHPAQKGTWLDVQPKRSQYGMDPNDWRVFRVQGIGGDAKQVKGPFRNKKQAMTAAKEISRKTGEPIGNPYRKK